MSRSTRSLAQVITAAVLLYPAAHLQASSSTAYVSVCCNAPSTAGVFNAFTLARTGSIVTGSGGDGLALGPDGTKLFVTVDNQPELQVISTATGTILATVPVPLTVSGTPPLELAINPDGRHVYIFAPQARPSSLLLAVDTTTYLVTRSVNLPANQSLGPLLVSPDGTQLYFEEGLVNQYIQVIDAATLAQGVQIPVNENPSALAVTPSGLILMTDIKNELLVIDPKAGTIVNRFTLPSENPVMLGAIVSSPDSTTAYMTFAGPSILAVNISTGATIFEAPTGYLPTQFALSSDGRKLYSIDYSVSNGAWNVSQFDIQTQKPVNTIRQLGPVSGLALSHDGASLYVLNAGESAIVSVDVPSQKPTQVTLGGVGINSVAIPPNGQTVWASSYEFALGGDILVLNRATGQLKFALGTAGSLTFSPDGTVLYAASPAQVAALSVPSMNRVATFHPGQLENIGQAIPSPDGKRLYVSITFVSGSPSQQTGAVVPPGVIVVLDASTFKPISVLNVPHGLGVFALTPDGSTLVCTSNHGEVPLIGTNTGAVTATIQLTPANGLLEGLALSADGSTAYVTDAENNLLIAANLSTHTQQAKVAVGMSPLGVAITPDASEAWVLTSAGLEVVSLSNMQVNGPVRLPGTPSAIAFAP